MVVHLERLNPAVRKLKEAIDRGWLGHVIHFAFTRVGGYPQHVKGGNNVLLDLAVHDIDVLNYLYGPMEHRASICHTTAMPGIYDTAEILLCAPDGASAAIHVNWITPTKIRTLRVTGTKGVCFVDYVLQTCELMGGDLLQRQFSGESQYPDFIRGYQNTDRLVFGVLRREPLLIQLENLVRELHGGLSEICSVDDALYAVRIAQEAIQAQIGPEAEAAAP
jgi:UDP-N-acetylglucosamine 3-dehydrogenase